jgi:pyruvate/2-oxoglutarate/acetoin dehydrogenase E1 component
MTLALSTGQPDHLADPSSYHDELCRAMTWLGEQKHTEFFGQGVGCPGTGMSASLFGVPLHKCTEMPVAEEMQVGLCVGASLMGIIPICIIPRWNFALRAADQIINHLDRMGIYSGGGYRPKVIIRVAVPSNSPFNPGAQHDGDFTYAFEKMLRRTETIRLYDANDIVPSYQHAYKKPSSTILVEYTDKYRDIRH